jgi:hypothetical protein
MIHLSENPEKITDITTHYNICGYGDNIRPNGVAFSPNQAP